MWVKVDEDCMIERFLKRRGREREGERKNDKDKGIKAIEQRESENS